MRRYSLRILAGRETSQAQYIAVLEDGREVCRTDSREAAQRILRGLELERAARPESSGSAAD